METEYPANRWLRALDMIGMVIAPISMSLIIFFFAILLYAASSPNGNYHTQAIIFFFGAIASLIILGYMFGGVLKRYINHQTTRDEVRAVRWFYSIFILGSLLVYFMIFYGFFLRP